MSSLRRLSFGTLFFLFVSCLLAFTSCKNKCGSTVCQNGGTCTDSKCVCPSGYSGSACQTGWSDDAIGTYNCTQGTCTPASTGKAPWQSAITRASTNGGYSINISNFDGNPSLSVTAIVDSAIDSSQSIRVSGTGAGGTGINANGSLKITNSQTVIKLNFQSYFNGTLGTSCTMTMVKI